MRVLIGNMSNTFNARGVDCICGGSKVSTTHNARSQSPQNIFNCYYNICAISSERVVIFLNVGSIFENTVFLRVCGGLRGSV
jgi:hypothetical protein